MIVSDRATLSGGMRLTFALSAVPCAAMRALFRARSRGWVAPCNPHPSSSTESPRVRRCAARHRMRWPAPGLSARHRRRAVGTAPGVGLFLSPARLVSLAMVAVSPRPPTAPAACVLLSACLSRGLGCLRLNPGPEVGWTGAWLILAVACPFLLFSAPAACGAAPLEALVPLELSATATSRWV